MITVQLLRNGTLSIIFRCDPEAANAITQEVINALPPTYDGKSASTRWNTPPFKDANGCVPVCWSSKYGMFLNIDAAKSPTLPLSFPHVNISIEKEKYHAAVMDALLASQHVPADVKEKLRLPKEELEEPSVFNLGRYMR